MKSMGMSVNKGRQVKDKQGGDVQKGKQRENSSRGRKWSNERKLRNTKEGRKWPPSSYMYKEEVEKRRRGT